MMSKETRAHTSGLALRADARRNRERVLVAAETLFLRDGAATSFEDVARHARVGIGTLYRRFPTREALLAAMCDERLQAVARASQARKRSHDPTTALQLFIEELVQVSNVYKGMASLLGAVLEKPTEGCEATTHEAERLLRQGKAAGAVRQDLSVHDLVCMITAVSFATVASNDPATEIERLVSLFLHGCLDNGNTGKKRHVHNHTKA